MTPKRITDVYSGRLFYINVSNFDKVDVLLAKHQKIGEVRNAPLKIVHIKDDRYSYLPGAHGNNRDGSVGAVHYKPTPDLLEQM